MVCFVGLSIGLMPFEIVAQPKTSKIALETIINYDESPAQIGDKFILIDFWATWCKPCIQTHPLLENLYAVFKDRITVIGVSNETESILETFAQKHNTKIPLATDYKGFTHEKYNVKAIPASFLLDPTGNIIWSGHPTELNVSKLSKLIALHKNKKPRSDKIWLAPPKKKVELEKNTLSAPVFLNNRKTIVVQKSKQAKMFGLITNEQSIIIEGPIHEVWSYLMCIPKESYSYINAHWNHSYRIEIIDYNLDEDGLKEIAASIIDHMGLDYTQEIKQQSAVELKLVDHSKLWDPDVFQYSEFPRFSSFMEGEDFFEGDNMSIQRLSFHLSNSYGIHIMSNSFSKSIHDWSLELGSLEELSNQLVTEYGVKLSEAQKDITSYKLL